MTTMPPVENLPNIENHPRIRALQVGEEPDVLALLGGWPFSDERRGEEFFARGMYSDPSFEVANVWVAEQGGALVSCCQIFPRPVRIAGEAVPAGGLGTVFTKEACRGRGLAGQVIAGAVGAMKERGYELSLLWSSQLDWYEAQGFRRWGAATRIWRLERGLAQAKLLGPSLAIEQFDQELHLDGVKTLSATYCAERHGTVLRGSNEWQASLALAGNPVEEFVVAKNEQLGEVIAFLRGCMLDGSWQVLEWACAVGHESHLAELIAVTLRTVGQTSVVAPALADERLERCLLERGIREEPSKQGTAEWLLRCLAPEALARRFGIAWSGSSEGAGRQDAAGLLAMVLPPPTFHFWTSDRF